MPHEIVNTTKKKTKTKIITIAVILLVIILIFGTVIGIKIYYKNESFRFDMHLKKDSIAQYFEGLENIVACSRNSGIDIDEDLCKQIGKDLLVFSKKLDYDELNTSSLGRIVSGLEFFNVKADFKKYQRIIDERFDPKTKLYSSGSPRSKTIQEEKKLI